jgi:ribonuclease HI
VKIFTDGSYQAKFKNFVGYATIFVKEETDEAYTIDAIYGAIYSKSYAKLRNVAGEVIAARIAINHCLESNIDDLEIFHDYTGVGMWADGLWKRNLPFTQDYYNFIQDARQKLKIVFRHVAGHSGSTLNDLADELAKEGIYDSALVDEGIQKTLRSKNIKK